MLRLVSASSLFIAAANAAVNPVVNTVKDLFIVNKEVSPDGFNRNAVLAGSSATDSSIIGPLITGLKGGTYNINVHNQLTNPDMILGTSIHWHGLLQRGSTWADGPAFVNQCPIAPGETFAYQFNSPDEAGTYWYHSHIGLQYCDGLRGPFIIYDKNDPHKNLYDVDDDTTVITVADWYHMLAKDFSGPSFPDAMLINGKGRYNGGPAVDLSVVSVKRNKRYRMRLLSVSCDVNFMFQIMGHDLNIIEADGIATQPHTVRSIRVLAGQRYSFVLNANQPVGNYWIRAKPAVSNGLDTFDGGLSSGILRYVGAPAAEPPATQTEDPAVRQLKESDLHALTNAKAPGVPRPGAADINLNLVMGFDLTNGPAFTVNGVSWASPELPVLNQILSGASTAQQLLPASSIIELPKNKVVEVSIPGGLAPSAPHPIHLHGHAFSVVRSEGSSNYNYLNPVRRDVVSTGDIGDNVTIRFTTDNAGAWFLHCHIDPHLELGFAVVFAESVPDVQAPGAAPPTAWQDLCPTWARLSADKTQITSGNLSDTALGNALADEAKAKGLTVS
ncbi:laccase 1 [Flagelloscypha sp. PMI_526]|nr:laccase 1 [Flagelloscypha sp. PMI_526]